MSKPRKRKDIAKSFLRLAATGKVREAYESFAAPDFRHHNPHFPGDAASLRQGMEDAHAKFPQTAIEFQRALEEGSLVAVHSRVKHGTRIAELWDIVMEAPERSPNENGLF